MRLPRIRGKIMQYFWSLGDYWKRVKQYKERDYDIL